MKKNDIILILGVIFAAAAVFCWSFFQKQEEGAKAVVYLEGEAIASYSLKEAGEYEIKSEKGTNRLIIRDGSADMTEADCPDGLCVKQHSIRKTGETIVCLPHKVVVEIHGGENTELDAITR